MNGKLILSIEDIPSPVIDPHLYAAADNPTLKGILAFQVINEIRKYEPEALTNRQCAIQLAKLRAMVERIDIIKDIDSMINKEENITEEMP